MYYMPDSFLASRRGVGTKPANALSSADKRLNSEDNDTNSAIDFSVRLGASIKASRNKSKFNNLKCCI